MTIDITTPRIDEVLDAVEARSGTEHALRAHCAAKLMALALTTLEMISAGEQVPAQLAARLVVDRIDELIDMNNMDKGEIKAIVAAICGDAEDMRKRIFGGDQ